MNFLSKKTIIIAIIIFILVGLFSSLAIYYLSPPQILSSQPANGAVGVSVNTNSIVLNFNYAQPGLKQTDLNITPALTGTWSIGEDKMSATFKINSGITPLTDYNINTTLRNRLGQLATRSLSFTTEYISETDLPNNIKQQYEARTDYCETHYNNGCPPKIDTLMPYTDPDLRFMVDLSDTQGHYQVTLFGNNNTVLNANKSAALSWIKSVGSNPTMMKIDFTAQSFSSDE